MLRTKFSNRTFWAGIALACSIIASTGVQARKGDGVDVQTLAARVTELESQVKVLQADNDTLQATTADLQAKTAAVAAKTSALSEGTDLHGHPALYITGVNVFIRDGSGHTDSTSGLGNLTIGYTALCNNDPNVTVRTGSHSLILGDQNNYSSYGGLVAGFHNVIRGPFASISGGDYNTTYDYFAASISGGEFNQADGNWT